MTIPLGRLSVFDMFRLGIGPSSSHTVGPMRAGLSFAQLLEKDGLLDRVKSVSVELYGSLGATGRGHATDRAVLLGLSGYEPETVPSEVVTALPTTIMQAGELQLLGKHRVNLSAEGISFQPKVRIEYHANALRFRVFDEFGHEITNAMYFSIGGGFVSSESELKIAQAIVAKQPANHDAIAQAEHFETADELLEICKRDSLSMSEVMLRDELKDRSLEEIRKGILTIADAMNECIDAGCVTEGILPGGLNVPRRAPALFKTLNLESEHNDPLRALDWVNLFALAVNEENAAGHRVVTAPTNGAAGIIPAVLRYYREFIPGANDEGTIRFLLAAAAVGTLIKRNASISGAEVGCQGEVGSASAMAAAGLAEVLGGTPEQVENAAEIGMEHNLGLTCDPIGGLVQIPCIERNAIGAVKAISAARMALRGDGQHVVSLDMVIKTMKETGKDMHHHYKETSIGGLAVNIIEC